MSADWPTIPLGTNRDFDDVAREEGPEAIREALKGATIPLIRPGSLSDSEGPTEESLAREWVAIHGRDWRFDHGVSRWYQWEGSRWKPDDTNLARHLIGAHLRAAASMSKKASALPRAGVAKGVEYFAQVNPDVGATHELWDSDPFLLGTPGGTVDLKTGQVKAADQRQYITRSTAVAPAAGPPARWLQFIKEATNGDPQFAGFLQTILGYCLTGSTREHALFFAEGGGGNGKSVLLNTATRILGDYATTAAMDTFTASKGDRHPTDLARLDGARLVAASETTEGRAWDESRIKQLTGGDRVAARYMRADFFEFVPRFKLLVVGNHAPVLHNVDEAMRRRFNVLPFHYKPPNPDRELEDKLAAEHPQILQWMIDGCLDWLKYGLRRPQVVIEATEGYFSGQDLLGQWLDDRCDQERGKLTLKRNAFEDWSRYARDNGEQIGTQNAFTRRLEKRGIMEKRNSMGRFYSGIDLRRMTQ
jgi:putative DNA primase/helicase